MERGTWDEADAERYGEWSAHMTADIPFSVGLAREADGPIERVAASLGPGGRFARNTFVFDHHDAANAD